MSTALERSSLPDRLETARLVLRAPVVQDAPVMAKLANNIKIHRMLSRMPHPYAHADAMDFITAIARSETEHAFALVEKAQGFIGVLGVTFPDGGGPPELGYWLGEPFWGKGYASEAGKAVVSATSAAGIGSIAARARAENTASRRVLEKLGFAQTSEALGSCGPHKGVLVATYRLEINERGHAQPA